MKFQILTVTAALLLTSGMAIAQEQQQVPSEKMQQGQGMMSQGMMGQGRAMGRGRMGRGIHMRLMMILIDTDGDGAVSLEEFQTAHARIFNAIDSDKDGKVTLEEMQTFFRGGSVQ